MGRTAGTVKMSTTIAASGSLDVQMLREVGRTAPSLQSFLKSAKEVGE